jgi:hypothetical protein
MHRDRSLKVEDFQGTNSTQAKILIYNQAVNWVLTEQRSKSLNRSLTELETEDLRRILTIDMLSESFPQKKMRLLQEQLKNKDLGQRQIDIYAGLNVMILLLELHRYAQQIDELKDKIVFYPCGKPNAEGKLDDANRLLRLINYSHCVGDGDSGFLQIVWIFLSGTNLSGANLGGTELCSADLNGANLNGAELSNAELSNAEHRSHLLPQKVRSTLIQAVAAIEFDRNNSQACCFTLPSMTSVCKPIKASKSSKPYLVVCKRLRNCSSASTVR